MALLEGRTMLEVLGETECWRRLSEAQVGRIAVIVDSAPEIYPMNFAVDGRTIVFRTDPGEKLRAFERTPCVSFEIDGVDEANRTGWSVLVKGRAERIIDVEQMHRVMELDLDLWSPGAKSRWIRLLPTAVTGRAIHPSHKAH